MLVRTSIVINEIKNGRTETLLLQEDWFREKDFQSEEDLTERIDKITSEYVEKAVQHDAEIHLINEPVALRKCSCGGCEGFLTNEIRAEDLKKIESPRPRLLH